MRKLLLLFLSLSFMIPVRVWAAPEFLPNTGLVRSNIWYSKDPFYAGDKIRIYSVIYTGSNKDLRGRVNFYDNKILLCTNEFASLVGRVTEVWCDWSVSAGKHSISIKITNPRASAPGEPEQAVTLSDGEFITDELVVATAPVVEAPVESPSASPVSNAVDNKPSSGIVQKIVDLFTGGEGAKSASDQAASSAAIEYINTLQSSEPQGASLASKSTKPKTGSKTFDTTVSRDDAVAASAATRSPLGYIAGAYPTLNAVKDYFTSFTARVSDWLLPKLKSLSENDNKPIGYVMSFVYTACKFILDTPIVFATIIIATIWKIASMIFSRDDY